MKWIFVLAAAMAFSWAPSPYAQTWALQRTEDEVHVGGNRGWGKTDLGMAWLVREKYVKHPMYRALVTRRNAKDLSDWFDRARTFYSPHGAKFVGNPGGGQASIHFPRGGIIRLGHLRDMAALESYMSHEYQLELIEQAEQIDKLEFYQRLTASCRSTIPELPTQKMSNSNPGGRGARWIKDYFIKSCNGKTVFTEHNVEGFGKVLTSKICIIGDVRRDMAHKPDYVRAYVSTLMGIKNPVLREAWLDGNYDIFNGQFFQDLCTYNPRTKFPAGIPKNWPRYRSMDWGYYPGYSAVGWYAIDFAGTVYKYRELYVQKTNPPELGRMIAEMSGNEQYVANIADPAIWTKNQYGREINAGGIVMDYAPGTSHSIQQEIEAAGNFRLTQAINDRIPGWAHLKTLQYHDAEHQAQWQVSEECPETIRVYPEQQYNSESGNPEDMDSDGEDHIPDADRYFAMAAVRPTAPGIRLPSGNEYDTRHRDNSSTKDDLAAIGIG